MTAELRIKQRAVTTREAAVEDDRSTGLQIGSVGVRGHLMNIHSKQASEQQRCEFYSPSTRNLQVAASFLSSRRGTVSGREIHCENTLSGAGFLHNYN